MAVGGTVSHEVEPKNAPASSETAPPTTAPKSSSGTRIQFRTSGSLPPVGPAFQAKAEGSQTDAGYDQTHAIAAHGVSGGGGSLPFASQIASSFGAEHAGTVQMMSAHTDSRASEATSALGAVAYASGNSVAFGGTPDLHTAAHEAAHVVQQKGGVQLKGGVGQAGDAYEQHADAVADRVVQGKSATDLLAPYAGGGAGHGVQAKPIQFLGSELGKPLPSGAEKPVYGEDPDQRRYSKEQYEKMWEAEQGKSLDTGDKSTIDRGCIGLTANNISGGGNPLESALVSYGTFDQAYKFMTDKKAELEKLRKDPKTAATAPKGDPILFAQLFWSNQKDGDNSKADDKAFKPDPKTGKVDMSGYKYKAQPGYVNFDYGWWDDSSHAFWHANHMDYGDPADPMKVYQSTKEHFIAGYKDFDRIVFCVALAENYDPGKAAITHATSH
jgi:hypothetical protein